MAISYNAGTNTLTVTGAGNTFAAIYAADVAGGWGVVRNQGQQYYFGCHIVIGDGSTITDLTDEAAETAADAAEAEATVISTMLETPSLAPNAVVFVRPAP